MFCSAQETMKLLPSCDNVGGTLSSAELEQKLREIDE